MRNMIHSEQLEIPGIPPLIGPPLKRCLCCLSVKPIAEFSGDRSRSDGLARRCRQCDSDRHKERRLENGDLMRLRARRRYSVNPEQKRQAAAAYRRTDRGKRLNVLAVKRYQARHTEKTAAHIEVRKALASGVLHKPERCELAHLGDCGVRLELHHDDYSRPLDVRALCTQHHNATHHKTRTYHVPAPLLDFLS